jgi:NADPH-dependent 2,4-dienoyl-CoA reductase/sulfur reductase-like enzyme/peroxiredoxin family protein/rhodanese-related sulfurtransferase/TusA-related sulfurtransferase
MGQKVLIVGGVAGGASTAARLRRVDEEAQIIMFERGDYISFANCGLPYYIGEAIEEREALLVQTPEGMGQRFNMDIRVRNEVLSIDKENKKVRVMNHNTNEAYEESYDVLVLSPGSTPLRPPIPGIDAPNIFSLWNIPDTDTIKGYVDEKKPQHAVVIGGGFIGLEMAENLHDRGCEVAVVEMADQVMQPIDFEMASITHQHMKQHGVDLRLGDGVKSFHHDKRTGRTTVELQSGAKIETDIIILSIGIRSNSQLAKDAGLEVNARGGIVVDDYMKTSNESIYALGDAIEVVDFNDKTKTMVPLAGPANKQGRIVANNIAGIKETYRGTQGTSIAKVFDLAVASTGHNEKTLKRNGKVYGKDYKTIIIHSKSHAGYYPGAMPMTLKMIYDLNGKVIGAQGVGHDGVDKRIDVIATAIRYGGTIYDLKDLELAYAPPFGSAKDPVNMLGFVAENVLTGKSEHVHWDQLDDFKKDETIILDVREDIERELGFIEGSYHIPLDKLRERAGELDKNKNIIVYCAVGLRGYVGERILRQLGFKKAYNLSGGYTTYSCMFCQDPEESDKCGGMTCDCDIDFSDDGTVEDVTVHETGEVVRLNACGLQCPGPIMQVYKKMEEMNKGDVLEVRATDPGFGSDIGVWAGKTGNTLLGVDKNEKKEIVARLMKGQTKRQVAATAQAMAPVAEDKTMVVFSGDMDKAIASLIIANGAASMGRKVTMFFTFWGLNVLRKHEPVRVQKDFLGKMFSGMMPRGTKKLGLSKMNMLGMGPKMIRLVMKKHNVDSLETLLQTALDNGVNIVACNMSMDLMGITEEELIDGVNLGGVATYLGAAEESNVNLFI